MKESIELLGGFGVYSTELLMRFSMTGKVQRHAKYPIEKIDEIENKLKQFIFIRN